MLKKKKKKRKKVLVGHLREGAGVLALDARLRARVGVLVRPTHVQEAVHVAARHALLRHCLLRKLGAARTQDTDDSCILLLCQDEACKDNGYARLDTRDLLS